MSDYCILIISLDFLVWFVLFDQKLECYLKIFLCVGDMCVIVQLFFFYYVLFFFVFLQDLFIFIVLIVKFVRFGVVIVDFVIFLF